MQPYLDDFFYFVQVAKYSGFSAASQATNIAKSRLSRHVDELERKYDVRLINRNTRHFSLTPLGEMFYEECINMLEQAEIAQNLLLVSRQQPSGVIRLSCPPLMMQYQVQDIIHQFIQRFPEVKFELNLTGQRQNPVVDQIDLALRVNFDQTEDSNLIVRDLVRTRHCLVVHPKLLQQFSIEKAEDILNLASIGLGNNRKSFKWQLRHKTDHTKMTLNFNPRIKCNDLAGVYCSAKSALGVADLPRLVVADDLKQGNLVEILPEWESISGIVQLVYASSKGQMSVIREFIEALVDGFESFSDSELGYESIY